MVISTKPVSCSELLERFPSLFVECIGDPKREFSAITSPDSATGDAAVFLATPKAIKEGLGSSASVLVVSKKAREQVEASRGDRTLLVSPSPELAMATAISTYFLPTPYVNKAIQGVHPTAHVSPNAQLGMGVRIGPHAFVGSGARLGAHVVIGANAVIEDDCEIGDETVIHPLAYVGHSTVIGRRCEVHPSAVVGKEGFGYVHDEKFNHYRIPHQGRVVLEDDVHIGAGCTLDRGTFGETRIEAGTKMDNQVHIAHNCRIGRNSLLTSGFTIAGSSRIGANFVAGGGTIVAGHLEVTDNVQVAGLSVIRKNLPQPGQYGGNPLQPLQAYIKTTAAAAHLPQMRKQISRILKKLGLEEEAPGKESPSEA